MWPSRIFDVFMVNDEFDLVEARLKLLADQVDFFIIGESDTTFSGRKKEPKFAHMSGEKVIHLLIEIPDDLANQASTPSLRSRWAIEEFQRDTLESKAREISTDSDLLLFTDVDEIPSAEQIVELVRTFELNQGIDTMSLLMPVSFRRLNWRLKGSEGWNKGKAFRGGVLGLASGIGKPELLPGLAATCPTLGSIIKKLRPNTRTLATRSLIMRGQSQVPCLSFAIHTEYRTRAVSMIVDMAC